MALILYTTTPNKKEAKKIAKILFKHKLVACIQMDKILSYYTWESKLCKEKEIRMCIKTTKQHYKKIKKLILKHHSYELPQIIALQPKKISKEFNIWIHKNTDTEI